MVSRSEPVGAKSGRTAARRATRLAAEQLESSPVLSGDETSGLSFGEPSRRKAHVKVTYGGKKTQRSYAKRRRSLSPLTSVESDSDIEHSSHKPVMSPFSSPPPATQSTPFKPARSRNPHTRSGPVFLSSRPRADSIPSVTTKLQRSQSLSSLSSISDDTAVHCPGWDIEDHRLAFVRIDREGNVSEDSAAVWWPAEVTKLESPMRVTLFGEYPGSSPKARPKELTVISSSSAILPFCSGPRQLRFNINTYASPLRLVEDLNESPRKRQKTTQTDLDSRWCDARNLMLKKYQDMNDGLPLTLSLHVRDDTPEIVALSATPQQRAVHQPSVAVSSEYGEFDDPWEPGESPYDIPGELVLAKEKRTFTQYWPAKLMAYIPPQHRGEKAQYQVLFYDGKVKNLPEDSDMFYDDAHPKFKSCLLGQDENNYGLDIGERDQDIEVHNHSMTCDEELSDESLRSLSPEPQVPAPIAFASELSVEEQFRYVKPVLVGILTGQFDPARPKHVGFMKGGKQRNTVVEAAWKRGEVTSIEKEQLSTCIVRWTRRRQRRQDTGLIPRDPCLPITRPINAREQAIYVLDDNRSDVSELTDMTVSEPAADDTEHAPSSDVEAPPSSFIAPEDPEDTVNTNAILDGDSALTDVASANRDLTERNGRPEDTAADRRDMSHNPPTALVASELPRPPPGTIPTFAHLSDLDQITYCTSVLLPESILQILLWRNGQRKSVALLPPAEEERLHRIAEGYASATYWVHDIVNLKRAAEGKLLPLTATSDYVDPESTPGKGRLRPRRK